VSGAVRPPPDFTPDGWEAVVEVGPVRLLRYRDGTYRVGHVCDRGDRGIIRCAPLLGEKHTVGWSGRPSVYPSILCPDCGLHGFVRGGQWVPA
jgi:hypothetical protein